MNFRWMVTIEPGAKNPKFDARMIFKSFEQIAEYWSITQEQVTRKPNIIFQLTTRNLGTNVAAATSGIRIFIGNYPFLSNFQLRATLTHEIGHVIFPGNRHASDPRNVMYAGLNDVYKNFYTEDPNWFRLQWKSNRRPWNEPNKWRPIRGWVQGAEGTPEYASDGYQPCNFGHIKNTWYEMYRNMVTPTKQLWVEE